MKPNAPTSVSYTHLDVYKRQDMGETYSPSTGINISETYPDDGYIITMSSGVMRNKDCLLYTSNRKPCLKYLAENRKIFLRLPRTVNRRQHRRPGAEKKSFPLSLIHI